MARVLILKLSSFGDILQTFYALEDLCRFDPNLKISWCVQSEFQELLKIHNRTIQVISFPLAAWKRGWYRPSTLVAVFQTIKALRSEKIDVSVDLQGMLKSAVIGFLSGAKTRVGPSQQFVSERGACYFYNRKMPISQVEGLASRSRDFLGSAVGYDFKKFSISSGLDGWTGGAEIAIFVGASTERKSLTKSELLNISRALMRLTSTKVALYWGSNIEHRECLSLIEELNSEQFAVAKRIYSLRSLYLPEKERKMLEDFLHMPDSEKETRARKPLPKN